MKIKIKITSLISLLLSLMLAASCSQQAQTESPTATCSEDLVGHSLGCLTGSLCDLQFEEYAAGATKQIYNTESDLLVALDKGKVDFIVMDSVMTLGIDRQIHPVETAFSVSSVGGDVGVAFRKDDIATCTQFNEFLAQIKADGTFREMSERWLHDDFNESVMPQIETYTEGKPFIVGTMAFLPFCIMSNGEWVGLEVEMMKRFAAYLHRPLEIKVFEFASLMAALKVGTIDVWCSFITINEERSKEVLFSDPYMRGINSVFQRIPQNKENISFVESIKQSFYNNLIVEDRWKLLVQGLWETIIISLFSLLLGTLLGGLVCLLRMSRYRLLSGFAKVYIDILRGVPMLVFLMIMFYVVFSSTGISGRWVAIVSFSINFSAYVSEIFRTGISAIDKGQWEAGLAMGFNSVKTFILFILPQAAKNILPVFNNEAVSLVKGTSIVGYVAIQDLTRMSDIIRSRTFDAFFPLIIVSIIYFILAWLLGKALDLLTKKIA